MQNWSCAVNKIRVLQLPYRSLATKLCLYSALMVLVLLNAFETSIVGALNLAHCQVFHLMCQQQLSECPVAGPDQKY